MNQVEKQTSQVSKAVAAIAIFLTSAVAANAWQANTIMQGRHAGALPPANMVEQNEYRSILAPAYLASKPVQSLETIHPFFPSAKATPILNPRITAGVSYFRSDKKHSRAAPSTAGQPSVFASYAIGFGSLPAAKKLNFMVKSNQWSVFACNTTDCTPQQISFSRSLGEMAGYSHVDKINSVNSLVNNRITYKRDSENYGTNDYWASPAETLQRGAGDCEDFALLKMASLESLGVPTKSMSIVVLRDDRRKLFHAVLTVRTNEGFIVLDNVRARALKDSALSHYTPLYSITAGKGFIHGRRTTAGATAMVKISFDNIAPGEGP